MEQNLKITLNGIGTIRKNNACATGGEKIGWE
jgi:hypothetical protein